MTRMSIGPHPAYEFDSFILKHYFQPKNKNSEFEYVDEDDLQWLNVSAANI